MTANDLSITFMSLGLGYPDRPQFAGTVLPELNASLASRYSFETFTHDRDGGLLVQEAQRRLTIWRSGMIIENEGSQDIALLKREFADIATEVMDHLAVPIFWEPRLDVRATWPLGQGVSAAEGDSTALMLRSAVNMNPDQLDQLGVTSVSGITVEVEAVDDDTDHVRHVHIEVGSYLRDPSKMHVSLLLTEHLQIQTPNLIENWMQDSHDYFMDKVVNFADSVTR